VGVATSVEEGGMRKNALFYFLFLFASRFAFFLPLPRRQCDILSRCPPSDLFSMSLAFSTSDLILWCLTPLALPVAHGCGGTLAAGPLVALLTTSIVTGIDHRPRKIRCSYARTSARGSTRRWGSLGVEAAIRRSRRLGARGGRRSELMCSRRRKAAPRRLCTCERLTWEHHLLRALPGGKQKPTQEGSTRLAASYKAFTTARV
jgi:hypothetical protein